MAPMKTRKNRTSETAEISFPSLNEKKKKAFRRDFVSPGMPSVDGRPNFRSPSFDFRALALVRSYSP